MRMKITVTKRFTQVPDKWSTPSISQFHFEQHFTQHKKYFHVLYNVENQWKQIWKLQQKTRHFQRPVYVHSNKVLVDYPSK